jgi:hypothetical protein
VPLVIIVVGSDRSQRKVRRSLHHRAAGSAFVVALPRPSSSRRRSLSCRAAGSAFVIALLLPLSSRRRRFCICQCAAAAFIVAPPLPSNILFTILLFTVVLDFCRWWIYIGRISLHTDDTDGQQFNLFYIRTFQAHIAFDNI